MNELSLERKDEGSALILVIIFITSLCSLVITLNFLTTSANLILNKQASSVFQKAEKNFGVGLEIVVDCLTNSQFSGDSSMGVKDTPCINADKGENNFGSFLQKCDDSANSNSNAAFFYNSQITLDGKQYMLVIDCDSAPYSGSTFPLANYMIVGIPNSSLDEVGLKAGIKFEGGCSALELNGSLLNSSGAWEGNTSCSKLGESSNILFTKSNSDDFYAGHSLYLAPDSSVDENCPAKTQFGQSCTCPFADTSVCRTKLYFRQLDMRNSKSLLSKYLSHYGEAPKKAGGTLSTFISSQCELKGGTIDNSNLETINMILESSTCSKISVTGDLYLSVTGDGPTSTTLQIPAGKTVLGDGIGVTLDGNAKLAIDGTLEIPAKKGCINSCTSLYDADSPSFDGTEKDFIRTTHPVLWATYNWSPGPSPALVLGESGVFITDGLILLKNGGGRFNNQSGMRFSNGVVLSGMTIFQNSPTFRGTLNASPSYNGNRMLQIRVSICDTKSGSSGVNENGLCEINVQDPILAHLEILDKFSFRTGSGPEGIQFTMLGILK